MYFSFAYTKSLMKYCLFFVHFLYDPCVSLILHVVTAIVSTSSVLYASVAIRFFPILIARLKLSLSSFQIITPCYLGRDGTFTIIPSITSNCLPDALSSQYFPGTDGHGGSGRRHLHKHMFDNVSDLTPRVHYITSFSWKVTTDKSWEKKSEPAIFDTQQAENVVEK